MCCLCRFFDCFLGGGSGGLNGLCNRAGLGLDISRINNTAYLNHTARRLLLRCLDLHLLVLAFCHHGRMLGFQSDVSNGHVNRTCQNGRVSNGCRCVCVPKKIAGPTTKPYFPRVNRPSTLHVTTAQTRRQRARRSRFSWRITRRRRQIGPTRSPLPAAKR